MHATKDCVFFVCFCSFKRSIVCRSSFVFNSSLFDNDLGALHFGTCNLSAIHNAGHLLANVVLQKYQYTPFQSRILASDFPISTDALAWLPNLLQESHDGVPSRWSFDYAGEWTSAYAVARSRSGHAVGSDFMSHSPMSRVLTAPGSAELVILATESTAVEASQPASPIPSVRQRRSAAVRGLGRIWGSALMELQSPYGRLDQLEATRGNRAAMRRHTPPVMVQPPQSASLPAGRTAMILEHVAAAFNTLDTKHSTHSSPAPSSHRSRSASLHLHPPQTGFLQTEEIQVGRTSSALPDTAIPRLMRRRQLSSLKGAPGVHLSHRGPSEVRSHAEARLGGILLEAHSTVASLLEAGVASKEIFACVVDIIMNVAPEIILQIIISTVSDRSWRVCVVGLHCIKTV